MKQHFSYGSEETDYLKSKDQKLGKMIDIIGHLDRMIDPDLFVSLIGAIVAQQISGKAADTVWNRILEKVGTVTPESLHQCSDAGLQSCGLSWRKVSYIRDFSEKVLRGEFPLEELAKLSDAEMIAKLDELKGIGPWTAEMMLIFSLGRPNILSFNDFAIQKGLRMLYGHSEITKELFEKYKKRFNPYATVASFYIWEIATNGYGLKDKQAKIRKNQEAISQ
jgi:3-methyladenine DNA glycosylase/8-oxoguanine DNA glycosylase